MGFKAQTMIGPHVKTPVFLRPLISGLFDPYPLGGGLAEPPAYAPIWFNPDYNKLKSEIPRALQWNREGHYIAGLIPFGDNDPIRDLIRHGVKRFIPDRRIFPSVRDVELFVVKSP